jgi:tetratricopeptide (TPR) repeat protein
MFDPKLNRLSSLALPINELNQVLNWLCFYVVLAVYPKTASAILGELASHQVASSYQALHQLVKAEKAKTSAEKILGFEMATQLDPNLEVAYIKLGKIFKNKRQYQKAISAYENALGVSTAADRVKATYAIEMGICFALLGEPRQAIQSWQNAIAFNPTSLNPYMNIAHTYEELDDLEQAEVFFRKAQLLSPGDSRLYYNLARIFSKKNEWTKALAQYQLQLVIDRQDPWCHSNIATCYLQLGDEANARKHLEKTAILDASGEAGQYANLILTGLSAESGADY